MFWPNWMKISPKANRKTLVNWTKIGPNENRKTLVNRLDSWALARKCDADAKILSDFIQITVAPL